MSMTYEEIMDGYKDLENLRRDVDAAARITARELMRDDVKTAYRYAALMLEAETKANKLSADLSKAVKENVRNTLLGATA